MSQDHCYLCKKDIAPGQSFYEDHSVKVCISCFRSAERCRKCRFPSHNLKKVDGFGSVCEFCLPEFEKDEGMTCYMCNGKIWSGASHYEDHGKVICQSCFKDATVRCFTCRFPKIKYEIKGHGGVCEFCDKTNLTRESNLEPFLKPLQTFLHRFGHEVGTRPNLLWINWKLILGMQLEKPNEIAITFFDELVRHCYPVYYLKGLFYIVPSIPRQWFMPFMASQMVAADLCKKFDLFHLRGNSPFYEMARGWCHWVAYSTAKTLKYDRVAKTISRWPESNLPGNFSKFLAMSEYRKSPEIVEFAQQNIKQYAKKYL